MAKKTIYKHTVLVTFFSEDKLGADSMSLQDIAFQMDEGDCVGNSEWKSSDEPITGKDAVEALRAVGSDRDFFNMDEEGNEEEDEDEG